MFEKVRGSTQTDGHAVRLNHLPKWSQASSSIRARKGGEKWNKTESLGQFRNQGRVSRQRGKTCLSDKVSVDQLPSRDNLQKWGLVEDTKCRLCGRTETLHQMLSNCTYALANGRYKWRHNQVLREVYEAAKAAVSKANLSTIAKQRKIYFLHEDFAYLCKKRCQTPR